MSRFLKKADVAPKAEAILDLMTGPRGLDFRSASKESGYALSTAYKWRKQFPRLFGLDRKPRTRERIMMTGERRPVVAQKRLKAIPRSPNDVLVVLGNSTEVVKTIQGILKNG